MTATSPKTENIWLAGNFGPVHEERTVHDLPVTGTLPAELDGRYLRNGPNPVDAPDPATYHWFTGAGMVHGIRLRDGKAEWYRNRYVRSPEVAAALGEDAPPSPYADDVRIFAANTNVIGHAGTTLAIVEAGGPPIELGDELDTIGPTDLDGTLEHPFSAHPKRDPRTGELFVMTYFWGWGDRVRYLVVGADGRVTRSVDIDLPAAGQPMVHDLAVTETRALVFDLPCTFDLEIAMAGTALPYRWNPDHGARVGLIDRSGDSSDVTWFDVDPCYVFHPLNAFDTPDGGVVVDLVRWPKMFDREVLGPNEGPTRLERWTIRPDTSTVHTEVLDDRGQEFPRHDERLLGRRHRYGYSVVVGDDFDQGDALKHDLERGTTEVHPFGRGRHAGELVFVPRAIDADEDDGWLMTLVYDETDDRSDLVVLHAQDFTGDPIATVHLPARVPYGFHGNWVPSDGR